MRLLDHVAAALRSPYYALDTLQAIIGTKQTATSRKRKHDAADSIHADVKRQRKTQLEQKFITPAKQIISEEALLDSSYRYPDNTPVEDDESIRVEQTKDEEQCNRQLGMEMDMDVDDDVSVVMSNMNLEEEASTDGDLTRYTFDEDSFLADDDAPESDQDKLRGRVVPFHKVAPIKAQGTPAHQIVDALLAEGWNTTHLKLVNHILHRGYEQVLPIDWSTAFRYFPQNLFAEDNAALLGMRKSPQHHGEIAFDRLLYLGGMLRSTVKPDRISDGEKYTKRLLTQYISAITKDTRLHKSCVLPLVSVIVGSETTDPKLVGAQAQRKLNRLAAKWEQALSCRGFDLPVPTLYAMVGVGPVIALAVRKPHDPKASLQTVSIFDFQDPDLDFWSLLALAMVVCHARDQQIMLAEETGIGTQTVVNNTPIDLDL